MKNTIKLIIMLSLILVLCVVGYYLSSIQEKTIEPIHKIDINLPQLGTVNVVSKYIYPDKTLTPGAINENITQDNINQTICNKNWSTKSIRPSSNYTTNLKIKQLNSGYNYQGDMNTKDYEEDHFISLELGGNPTSELNLWPESYNTQPVNAKDKDLVENSLHKEICAGVITLKQAQDIITSDWYSCYLTIKKNNICQ